jgi:DNA polymerase III alpha subunit
MSQKNNSYSINFNPKIEDINLECSRTWEIISDGNTKGCFQLESRLGRSMAKKLKPENIEQLSALISIMRPGCISGDTKIYVKEYKHSTDGRSRFLKYKIRDIVNNISKYQTLLSYNEYTGKFVDNEIINAFYSGEKECFKVIIRSNERKTSHYGNKEYKLECTNDHRLFTPNGWKCLQDIQIGDRVLVTKRNGTKTPGLGHKTFRQRCYNNYQTRCIFCDWNNGSLDVNHINGNRLTNNDPDNLCYMCPNHHREFSEGSISITDVNKAKEKYRLPPTIDGKWCTLAYKISIGITDVYDISMKAPHHNFIAGGVIVHNCLEAVRDGKTVSNHYIDKKNGAESVDYFHECLEPILGNTYGEMVYQEQAMEITKVVAGFDLQEADMLRKAIGKKKPEEMAKVKTKFLEGAKKLGIVTVDEAEQIFGWIEKSQRYSFNKSHSVSYAINAYLSAYTKAHFPKIFFASYLRFAKDKIDPQAEIKELVQNAHEMDINVYTPDIRNLNEFFILKNNNIYFGITDIKGVGKSVYDKLVNICANIDWNNITWPKMLFLILNNVNSTAAKALIQCGALSFIRKTRNEMLHEYSLISGLTKKELEHITNSLDSISDIKQGLELLLNVPRINQKRKSIIKDLIYSYVNPPYSLEDTAEWLADSEDTLLGCAITCSKIDMYDISMTNINCREFKNTTVRENLILGGEIDFINVTKTKTGKKPGAEMAFVTMTDSYGSVDSIIFFPEKYIEYKNILFPNNIIIVKGNKSKTGDGLIVDKAYIAKT